ncbi:MAG: preprotein translocase subunit SecA [Candidatus Goldiibacteriota bacterium]
MFDFIKNIFGTKHEREVKKLMPLVEQINSLEPDTEKMSDEELRSETLLLKQRLKDGETLDDILPAAFAVVREASKRALGLRHYDVQLIGGIVLHRGRITEMKTGEGKTLVATLPVYLNALAGKGVHVITVNDYLAERDSLGVGNFPGMGEVYKFLGLTVGCLKNNMPPPERREAYACDITYGTNSEFGFDYLRDNMAVYPEERVQRSLNYCIIDEVDSILIDEARTPLIISGPGEKSTELYYKIDKIIPKFVKTTDYQVDEKANTATLSEEGVAKAEQLLGVENLYDPQNIEVIHHINQALKAHTLFKKEKDYIVKEGKVIIVDEFTGRLMPGRRFSDGLHQALEAKERVKIERENQTLATITLQNYFRMYEKLAGMTGTAETESEEFWQIYKLDVMVVPTNREMVRIDRDDAIYKNVRGKFKAIADEIGERHRKGQPVLVGTTSIEKNEMLSGLLKKRGIPHNLLNAKNHEREAEIIAGAGGKGAVTVATNMAGRGTDIKIGDEVRELGGLYVLGTERHESRRIDNQLRGRAGRQGDPGESRFFVSLEDDLMRIFGSEKIQGIMERVGMEEDEVVENRIITRSLERAQKSVEGHHFSIRKHLLEFDDVMNQQRTAIYSRRLKVLEGENIKDTIIEMVSEVIKDMVYDIAPEKTYPEEWGFDELNSKVSAVFPFEYKVDREKVDITKVTKEMLENDIFEKARESYEKKEKEIGSEMMRELERNILLQVTDTKWREHLYSMDKLKEGIGLRAYAQKDPLLEYKKEGFLMFQSMMVSLEHEVVDFIFKVQIVSQDRLERKHFSDDFEESRPTFVVPQAQQAGPARPMSEREMHTNSPEGAQKPDTYRRDQPKVGRNELCPCGSGKKYKKCCGKNA